VRLREGLGWEPDLRRAPTFGREVLAMYLSIVTPKLGSPALKTSYDVVVEHGMQTYTEHMCKLCFRSSRNTGDQID